MVPSYCSLGSQQPGPPLNVVPNPTGNTTMKFWASAKSVNVQLLLAPPAALQSLSPPALFILSGSPLEKCMLTTKDSSFPEPTCKRAVRCLGPSHKPFRSSFNSVTTSLLVF